LLERLGFTISEAQVYEIMRQMDENFDGRISFQELRRHIKHLGFEIEVDNVGSKAVEHRQFIWRDKSIEVIIRVINGHLNQKPIEDYFAPFDLDHDNYLTPSEFRTALLSLKDNQLKRF
jgi:Ca2+-binding EF-hand superfamily protein